ncbi:MAG: hypothetical protein V2J12_04490 [Gammaproteobacteria bacterium]|jgi:hypothetical protein|nr:hypothetical protein [Gammaproteobacteria bacterium]
MNPTYLDPSNRLHGAPAAQLECPHCSAEAPLLPVATPDFRALQQARPQTTGMVFQCTSCQSPVFYKFRISAIEPARITFDPKPRPVETQDDRFSLRYLPERVATYFRDALGCYHHDLLYAFGAMCRLTTQAVIEDLGETEQSRIAAQVEEIAQLANLDEDSYQLIRTLLFDVSSGLPIAPGIDRRLAGILLECMKDLLQQAYIRRRRLRKVLQMRQFFADTRATPGMSDESLINVSTLSMRRSTGTE